MNLSFLVIVARNHRLLRSMSLVGKVKRGKREKERESAGEGKWIGREEKEDGK